MAVTSFLGTSRGFGKQKPEGSQPWTALLSVCLLGWGHLPVGCVSFVCIGEREYWEIWEAFVLLKGSRLTGGGFLICGPGAQASRYFQMFLERPPDLAAGSWCRRSDLPICTILGCLLGWTCFSYLSNLCWSVICSICCVHLIQQMFVLQNSWPPWRREVGVLNAKSQLQLKGQGDSRCIESSDIKK